MKRILCLVTALCMALALLPCGASAVDIIGEVEKAKKALRSVEKMLMLHREAQQNRTRTVSPAAIPSKANYRVKSKKHL